ncbi:hypothetical protein L0V05_05870 [Tabrizicola sp. J26]|uniref:hypothetical protein n=1 Tax=Alitabrizicola rongguiensis TaxID=2909234 RepID=UPI001F3DE509|nr:hypothetical protein [Tabrizicola rongguiensis]MCF1708344.1 hypothetical protein [Tabrizicola rongguiensis]
MSGILRFGCLAAVGALCLAACDKPLGPDATPEQLAIACDNGDLDACSRAAHLRSSAYEASVTQ